MAHTYGIPKLTKLADLNTWSNLLLTYMGKLKYMVKLVANILWENFKIYGHTCHYIVICVTIYMVKLVTNIIMVKLVAKFNNIYGQTRYNIMVKFELLQIYGQVPNMWANFYIYMVKLNVLHMHC